jgi:hypothetical protein
MHCGSKQAATTTVVGAWILHAGQNQGIFPGTSLPCHSIATQLLKQPPLPSPKKQKTMKSREVFGVEVKWICCLLHGMLLPGKSYNWMCVADPLISLVKVTHLPNWGY